MSLLKKLAGETMVYGLSSILGRLLNYVILTPYLTREFTNRAEYGIVTELYAYIALLLVFFTYRMETTFFRYGNQKEHADRAFSTAALSVMISTAFLVALFIGMSGPIAVLLDYPDHPEYIGVRCGQRHPVRPAPARKPAHAVCCDPARQYCRQYYLDLFFHGALPLAVEKRME